VLERLFVPGRSQCFFEIFNSIKSNVCCNIASCLFPALFCRIKFWCCCWEEKKKNFFWMLFNVLLHFLGGMPFGFIENAGYFSVGFSELFQEGDCLFRNLSFDKFVMELSFERVSAIRTSILMASVHMHDRCCAYGTPAPFFICVSFEVCFVYADDSVFICQREDLPLEFFLKRPKSVWFWF